MTRAGLIPQRKQPKGLSRNMQLLAAAFSSVYERQLGQTPARISRTWTVTC